MYVDEDGTCPEDREYDYVFSRLWRGTVEGCDASSEEESERFQVQTLEGYH